MKINQFKKVQVEAKTLRIHLKVCDNFTADLVDQNGEVIFNQEDGYVPAFMPGEHYGDYVDLEVDLDTGLITNWKKLKPQDIEDWVTKNEA
jgi:hypothetical protein